MINTIRQQLYDKIVALDKIQEVNDYSKTGFEGFPAVNITYVGNDSSFWSVASNQRGYNFVIRVYFPLNSQAELGAYNNSKQLAEKTIADAIDDILDALDTDISLGATVEFMRAAPSSMGVVEIGEGEALAGDINIQAVCLINTRS